MKNKQENKKAIYVSYNETISHSVVDPDTGEAFIGYDGKSIEITLTGSHTKKFTSIESNVDRWESEELAAGRPVTPTDKGLKKISACIEYVSDNFLFDTGDKIYDYNNIVNAINDSDMSWLADQLTKQLTNKAQYRKKSPKS